MSRNNDRTNAWFDDLDGTLDGVTNIVSEKSTEYYKERFIQKEWEGVPWPAYQGDPEPTKGSLMMRDNLLFGSIHPSTVNKEIVIISAGGSKVPYARVHNEGRRVRAVANVRPHHKVNFMGLQKRVQIKGNSRKVDFKMPQRRFIGPSARNNKMIRTSIITYLNQKK